MKNMIIASTSTCFGGSYLEYLLPELKELFRDLDELLFIPYARPGGISHDAYTDLVRKALSELPLEVKGIHQWDDPREALGGAQALFTGGGNTFVLVDQLHKLGLMSELRNAVLGGVPYLGTSAGSNIAGLNVKTTNDMPICHPDSLDALGVLPFNINPHYLDPIPGLKHMGETRETRIREFHTYNSEMVVGLREGSWIRVRGQSMVLAGEASARIFQRGREPFEIPSGTDLLSVLSD